MFSVEMPPTASILASDGNTARQALTICAGMASAGNSFSASAPPASALKPSLGVATPGMQTSFSALASSITSGIEMRHDDQLAAGIADVDDVFRRHHRAGADHGDFAVAAARRSIEERGLGEFIGTSMMRKPAATSASETASISSTVMPRNIATNGQAENAESKVQGPSPSNAGGIEQCDVTQHDRAIINHASPERPVCLAALA